MAVETFHRPSASTKTTAKKIPLTYELFVERPPDSLVKRFFVTLQHMLGLVFGGLFARRRHLAQTHNSPLQRFLLTILLYPFVWLIVDKKLVAEPFPKQVRVRLERLGPTYIKLGQILSLREDLLPKPITKELKHLLDRLPALPIERFRQLVQQNLDGPVDFVFKSIDRVPLGSASIAQTHRSLLNSGEEVVIKLVKPGIRETILRDVTLLKLFATIAQVVAESYQPKRIIYEFCDYTVKEVDLRTEAENAEAFAANFTGDDSLIFPQPYRQYSNENMLTMEFIKGRKPDADLSTDLSARQRSRLIDIGISGILRMFYDHGFFHADLHPGNLLVLDDGRAAAIDLGMVGRVDSTVQKNMFYYNYSLVMGDAENAARFLTAMTEPTGKKSDLAGFRRAAEALSRRWIRTPNFSDFSIGQLIIESVGLAAQYRLAFPVEVILLLKAFVTFEGVGQLIEPDFDLAKASRKHMRQLFLNRFNPSSIVKQLLKDAPELIEESARIPMLLSQSLQLMEKNLRNPPTTGGDSLKGVVFAGFALVAGAILATSGMVHPAVWGSVLVFALILALKS